MGTWGIDGRLSRVGVGGGFNFCGSSAFDIPFSFFIFELIKPFKVEIRTSFFIGGVGKGRFRFIARERARVVLGELEETNEIL